MECPSRLKHRCNRSTAPGSWQPAGSSIMPKHVVLAHWLTRLAQSQHWPTVSVGKLKAVNGVPLPPQAQVPPKHGSMMLAVSWQFDHAEACGPRSLASRKASTGPLSLSASEKPSMDCPSRGLYAQNSSLEATFGPNVPKTRVLRPSMILIFNLPAAWVSKPLVL